MTTLPERSGKATPTKEPGIGAEPGAPASWGTGSARQMRRSHVRGSSLLVVGRIVTLLLTTATQVVVVRALTKSDFGAFSYALSLGAAGRTVLSLGQGRLLLRRAHVGPQNAAALDQRIGLELDALTVTALGRL